MKQTRKYRQMLDFLPVTKAQVNTLHASRQCTHPRVLFEL